MNSDLKVVLLGVAHVPTEAQEALEAQEAQLSFADA